MDVSKLKPSELLPHREPMLLVDKILHTDFNSKITTQTKAKKDAFYFKGHFPDHPLVPGVIMIEMMFQTCSILNRITMVNAKVKEGSQKKVEINTIIGRAVKIKSATFIKEVLPNTTLTITVEKISNILRFSEYRASITVDDQKVCTAELTSFI